MYRILLGLALATLGATIGRAELAAETSSVDDPARVAPAESAVQVAIRALRNSAPHIPAKSTLSLASYANVLDGTNMANPDALVTAASFSVPCAQPAPYMQPMVRYCPPPCCPPPCCEPCCPPKKIIYHQRRGCCKVCCVPCGCGEPSPIKTVLKLCDPCTGCPTKIPVTLPFCTVGKPGVSYESGIFGRAVVWYTWSNGFAIKVVFKKCADEVIVTSYGS